MSVKNKKILVKFIAISSLIIVVGSFFTYLSLWWVDKQLRDDLLRQGKMVIPAIEINDIKQLSGSESDLTLPSYVKLKKQLSAIRSTDFQLRFTYLLGRQQNGDVFFFVDNENPQSTDYSPPGQIYKDATDELKNIFTSKSAIIEGPVSDKWGVFVSSLVPITDPASGETVAVMGMDIDARNWNVRVILSVVWPVTIVIVLLIIMIMWFNGTRVTADLRESEKRLEFQHNQGSIITEMWEFLQACLTTTEVGEVISKSMKKLFPESSGALFLLSSSRTDLESIAKWGAYPDSSEENLITLDECWGLRRGTLYISENNGILCQHIKDKKNSLYACLPLMAKGDVLGLMHIRLNSLSEENRSVIERINETSTSLMELLSLAISNIKLRETLSLQSTQDPLTGLFNRRYLEETFQREINRAKRKKTSVGVIMVDIDYFKKFNDIFGHSAGDLVLAELAHFFTLNLRGTDIVCRYGGEEFTLVIPDSSLDDTFIRAEQLVRKVKDLDLKFNGKTLGKVTLSMGVSSYPAHGETLDKLLKAADEALYCAKEAGRDRAVVAEIKEKEVKI